MSHETALLPVHPAGEQPVVDLAGPTGPPGLDTFAGKVTVEWDTGSALTPLGQMPFFIEFLKAGGEIRSKAATDYGRRRTPAW